MYKCNKKLYFTLQYQMTKLTFFSRSVKYSTEVTWFVSIEVTTLLLIAPRWNTKRTFSPEEKENFEGEAGGGEVSLPSPLSQCTQKELGVNEGENFRFWSMMGKFTLVCWRAGPKPPLLGVPVLRPPVLAERSSQDDLVMRSDVTTVASWALVWLGIGLSLLKPIGFLPFVNAA